MAKSRLNDITYDQTRATASKNPAPFLLIADNSLPQENENRKKKFARGNFQRQLCMNDLRDGIMNPDHPRV